MYVILIDPVTQTIETMIISGYVGIVDLIGQEIIKYDAVGEDGDLIYFDENCFVRGTEGRFQIDNLMPLAGKGVIVGTNVDDNKLQNVVTDIEDLRNRIKYL